MSDQDAQAKVYDEPLGYSVTEAAKMRLEEIRLELRKRGRKAQFGHILDILILTADCNHIEPHLPAKRPRRTI